MKWILLAAILLFAACASGKAGNNAALSKTQADSAIQELDRETGMPDSLK